MKQLHPRKKIGLFSCRHLRHRLFWLARASDPAHVTFQTSTSGTDEEEKKENDVVCAAMVTLETPWLSMVTPPISKPPLQIKPWLRADAMTTARYVQTLHKVA